MHLNNFRVPVAVSVLASGFLTVPVVVNAQPSGDTFIRARHSDKCLHISTGGQRDGLPATQWSCINQNNVRWRLEPSNEPGYYKIRVNSSDKCLQVDGSSQANGARISQWRCVDQANVKWRLIPLDERAGGDYYNIRAKHSDKCLQVNGSSRANGAAITQWRCVSQPNVQWKFE